MSQQISLKEMERTVFRSTFQDGLVDIFIGCFTSMFAIAPFLSTKLGDFWSSVIFLPIWAIVFLVLWLIKKHVVKPRVGTVNYGSWRKSRMIKFNVIIFFILVISLILGVLSFVKFDSMPGWIHTARFSLIILIAFSVAAYFLDFTRLYLYGALLAFAPMIGELLYVYLKVPHHGFPITFGFASCLIMIPGLVIFIRLLREHPRPSLPTESEVMAE